jgi:MvaI/BcnI restriction endonuclease family
MKIYTKESLIQSLHEIHKLGWIHNINRIGNHGAIGNILEDLLEIEENNIPIPNASEWELKVSRLGSTALTSLCHLEPSPRAMRLVPQMLLPLYGWRHQEAGRKYPETEISFRQTINTLKRSDRGFTVAVDEVEEKITISFDAKFVVDKHQEWLKSVENRVALGELVPQPYWGFKDLGYQAATKLGNLFYVQAEKKKMAGQEYFYYRKAFILRDFSTEKFIQAVKHGFVYVDFDAGTGHNHGTKFRIRSNIIENLYDEKLIIFDN